ncbi:MAG: PqqD family protein [Clostridia bacterium]|nr:PqqD family protein [Clostridia bacterium]
MKLKTKYILKTVADKTVAIAIEQGSEATDGVITLNDTGAFIFSNINEGADFDTIVDRFFEEYDVTPEEASKAVENFVEYLKSKDLLEDNGQTKMKL